LEGKKIKVVMEM